MMTEYDNVAQKENGIFRRWFQDDYFDLIVWYGMEDKELRGFQLCYDKNRSQHALTWHRDSGFAHNRIDDSRAPLRHPTTPILVQDGIFPAGSLIEKFELSSKNIDPQIRSVVLSKIIEFGSTAGGE